MDGGWSEPVAATGNASIRARLLPWRVSRLSDVPLGTLNAILKQVGLEKEKRDGDDAAGAAVVSTIRRMRTRRSVRSE